jgi:CheY-like chemotaxis protein
VKERGGEMRIDSTPGAGTRVEIWLPLCDAPLLVEPQDDQLLEEWPAGRRISGRILFVEDDDDLRLMGHRTLISTGVDVVLAPSAEDALTTLALQGPFDAMVTDIMLPGMSGIELANAARQSHPRLPVLFMTGYTGTLPADAQPAPGAPLLRKPYQPDALRLRVADLIEQASLQGSKR